MADSKQKASHNPLIPEKYLDVPSQRLYYLSLGLLCQVFFSFSMISRANLEHIQSIKAFDFFWSFASGEPRTAICRKWLFVDLAYCVVLSQLRIPRLQYSRATVLLQVLFLWFIDGVMFGGISLNLPALLGENLLVSTPGTYQGMSHQ